MNRIFFKSFALLFLALLCQGQLQAQQEKEWMLIGSRKAAYGPDHDVIRTEASEQRFSKLKIEVLDADVNMDYCLVHFRNGGNERVDLRQNFNEGTRSRSIDLKGEARFIEKIEFWYDTKNKADKKATINV